MGVRSEASVVVATRNRRDLLGDLLTSLARCDPLPAEVVVVDDAGDDALDPSALANVAPFRLRVVRNDRCVGPGAARNRGVHASRGDLLLFTDDDCVVRTTWVGALASALESRGDEMLGGVGGRVLARDRDLLSRYFEFHRILEPRPHDAEYPRRIPYLVTANCGIRRDVFMRAGGFDGRIPAAGGEDAALSMRIVRSGYHFEREENAVVEHRFRPGLREFAQTFYRYGLGGRYVVDRYLPR
jgi:glycosyltransferase involved in cell wall biosynthesis